MSRKQLISAFRKERKMLRHNGFDDSFIRCVLEDQQNYMEKRERYIIKERMMLNNATMVRTLCVTKNCNSSTKLSVDGVTGSMILYFSHKVSEKVKLEILDFVNNIMQHTPLPPLHYIGNITWNKCGYSWDAHIDIGSRLYYSNKITVYSKDFS